DVAMAVLERRSEALARRKAGSQVQVLGHALLHLDDDDLASRRHLRVFERDRHAREGAERGDTLFALSYVARAVGLAVFEFLIERATFQGQALQDEARARAFGASKNDAVDVDALSFADDEAGSRARAVGRKIDDGPHVREREAFLLEGVEDAHAGGVDVRLRQGFSESEVGLLGEILFDEDSVALERDVVERRARAELDRNASGDRGLARDALLRVGHALKALVGRRLVDGDPLRVVETRLVRLYRRVDRDTLPRR